MSIESLIKHLNNIISEGTNILQYSKKNNINRDCFSKKFRKIKNKKDKLSQEFCSLYLSLKNNIPVKKDIINEDRCEVSYIRDANNKIIKYKYKIYKRNKRPIIGAFDREEMDLIYRLYTYNGARLTQKQVNRHFPDILFNNFKSILKAFNITKADAFYAPHKAEECSEEELLAIKRNIINDKIIANVERNAIKNLEKENIRLYQEKEELNNYIQELDKFDIPIKEVDFNSNKNNRRSIMLNLADFHIGAKLESNSIYNNEYNYQEVERRLNTIIQKIKNLGEFDNVFLVILGDMLDGMNNTTARGGHYLPQNMDNMEQVKNYISIMYNFVSNIITNVVPNGSVFIHSVPNGNHTGTVEYVANKYLINKLNNDFQNVCAIVSDKPISHFVFNNETFIVLHGKDEKHQKRPYPKELNDFTKVKFYEYCEYHKISSERPVYILKGDLHTDNINSDIKFVYRNCLSLFGSSDYANANYTRNPYGMSYELFIGDEHLHGSFKNV